MSEEPSRDPRARVRGCQSRDSRRAKKHRTEGTREITGCLAGTMEYFRNVLWLLSIEARLNSHVVAETDALSVQSDIRGALAKLRKARAATDWARSLPGGEAVKVQGEDADWESVKVGKADLKRVTERVTEVSDVLKRIELNFELLFPESVELEKKMWEYLWKVKAVSREGSQRARNKCTKEEKNEKSFDKPATASVRTKVSLLCVDVFMDGWRKEGEDAAQEYEVKVLTMGRMKEKSEVASTEVCLGTGTEGKVTAEFAFTDVDKGKVKSMQEVQKVWSEVREKTRALATELRKGGGREGEAGRKAPSDEWESSAVRVLEHLGWLMGMFPADGNREELSMVYDRATCSKFGELRDEIVKELLWEADAGKAALREMTSTRLGVDSRSRTGASASEIARFASEDVRFTAPEGLYNREPPSSTGEVRDVPFVGAPAVDAFYVNFEHPTTAEMRKSPEVLNGVVEKSGAMQVMPLTVDVHGKLAHKKPMKGATVQSRVEYLAELAGGDNASNQQSHGPERLCSGFCADRRVPHGLDKPLPTSKALDLGVPAGGNLLESGLAVDTWSKAGGLQVGEAVVRSVFQSAMQGNWVLVMEGANEKSVADLVNVWNGNPPSGHAAENAVEPRDVGDLTDEMLRDGDFSKLARYNYRWWVGFQMSGCWYVARPGKVRCEPPASVLGLLAETVSTMRSRLDSFVACDALQSGAVTVQFCQWTPNERDKMMDMTGNKKKKKKKQQQQRVLAKMPSYGEEDTGSYDKATSTYVDLRLSMENADFDAAKVLEDVEAKLEGVQSAKLILTMPTETFAEDVGPRGRLSMLVLRGELQRLPCVNEIPSKERAKAVRKHAERYRSESVKPHVELLSSLPVDSEHLRAVLVTNVPGLDTCSWEVPEPEIPTSETGVPGGVLGTLVRPPDGEEAVLIGLLTPTPTSVPRGGRPSKRPRPDTEEREGVEVERVVPAEVKSTESAWCIRLGPSLLWLHAKTHTRTTTGAISRRNRNAVVPYGAQIEFVDVCTNQVTKACQTTRLLTLDKEDVHGADVAVQYGFLPPTWVDGQRADTSGAMLVAHTAAPDAPMHDTHTALVRYKRDSSLRTWPFDQLAVVSV